MPLYWNIPLHMHEIKKADTANATSAFGDPDETRTRDPKRDRLVF